MKGIVAMDNKNNNKRNRFYFNQRLPHQRPKMSNLSEFDLDIIKELGLDDDESTKSKQKSSFDDDADFWMMSLVIMTIERRKNLKKLKKLLMMIKLF